MSVSSAGSGGIASQFRRTGRQLPDLAIDLAQGQAGLGRRLFEQEQGIEVHRFRFPSGNKPLNQTETIPVFAMGVYMLSGLSRVLRLILKEKPDVIHGHWIVPAGLIAALAGFLTRTPVINTARGMDVRVSEKGLVRLLFDLAVKLSQHVTVVSEAMRSRPSLSAAEVISSGVDEAFFRIAPDRSSKTILHTRALEKVYDVEALIRAVPLVLRQEPQARFVIVGTGSHEQGLKACLLYTSDAADDLLRVDLGGRPIIKKKKHN